jgi:hypothetical protein
MPTANWMRAPPKACARRSPPTPRSRGAPNAFAAAAI